MSVTATEVLAILYLSDFSDWHNSALVICTISVCFSQQRILKQHFGFLLSKYLAACTA